GRARREAAQTCLDYRDRGASSARTWHRYVLAGAPARATDSGFHKFRTWAVDGEGKVRGQTAIDPLAAIGRAEIGRGAHGPSRMYGRFDAMHQRYSRLNVVRGCVSKAVFNLSASVGTASNPVVK